MPFEELVVRTRPPRTEWGLSMNQKGEIAIWIPVGHPITQNKRVRTLVGNKEDVGLIRLMPTTEGGRVLNASTKTKTTTYHIKFTTLTGAPKGSMDMRTISSRQLADGIVELTLPWYKPKPVNFGGHSAVVREEAIAARPDREGPAPSIFNTPRVTERGRR
jgi:hypothetical protein